MEDFHIINVILNHYYLLLIVTHFSASVYADFPLFSFKKHQNL